MKLQFRNTELELTKKVWVICIRLLFTLILIFQVNKEAGFFTAFCISLIALLWETQSLVNKEILIKLEKLKREVKNVNEYHD